MRDDPRKMDVLLKCNGLRKSSGMPWADISAFYEAETGKKVPPRALMFRVRRAVAKNAKNMLETHGNAENAPEKAENTVENAGICEKSVKSAFFRFLGRVFGVFAKKRG